MVVPISGTIFNPTKVLMMRRSMHPSVRSTHESPEQFTKVLVEEYQRVKPAQLLLQLDPGKNQVAVEQARAQLREPTLRSIPDDRYTFRYSRRSARRRQVTLGAAY